MCSVRTRPRLDTIRINFTNLKIKSHDNFELLYIFLSNILT